MKTAIYGKGGIGKSTVAANLSAALADEGLRVLQIGCDPKQDSTRLLLDGRRVTAVLDYMRRVPPARQRLDRLLHKGYGGVACAEAGGPEPGVGCAGRGILSTFALFDRLGLRSEDYDVVIYDVLGDVVCGGFAVPLRKGFADVLYIVTSEEFMAIYAANNILRGVQNFDGPGGRLAGLILNSRGTGENPGPVERFARAVGLPIAGRLTRSDRFRRAEARNQTVIQAFPRSPESRQFRQLARKLRQPGPRYPARPLSDAALEHTVLGRPRPVRNQAGTKDRSACDPAAPAVEPDGGGPPPEGALRWFSKSMLFREPLHGCAFTGAISTTTQIRGALTVAHGPRSCSHIATRTILASGIRAQTRQGLVLPRQLAPALISSDMTESAVIHGGGDDLVRALRQALARRPEAVFVVSTCPAGIIGDELQAAVRQVRDEFPHVPMLCITADGNIRGDYMQGVINASIEGAAALIDPALAPRGDRVNILAEKNIANNAESNFATVTEMLGALGVAVNCRFVRDTSVEALRGFGRARLNLLAYEDHFGRVLRDFFTRRFGAAFAPHPFPVGFAETERWLHAVAGFFGKTDAARALVAEHESDFAAAIGRLRPRLAGRRLMIVSYVHDVDWILETAFGLEMTVEKVGILDYSQDHRFRTRYRERFELQTGYTPRQRDADLVRIRPDLLLCNYVPGRLPVAVHVDGIPLCPNVGFYSGLPLARRWASLLKAPVREGWRDDGD
jgi:nitrogenase iron protein